MASSIDGLSNVGLGPKNSTTKENFLNSNNNLEILLQAKCEISQAGHRDASYSGQSTANNQNDNTDWKRHHNNLYNPKIKNLRGC